MRRGVFATVLQESVSPGLRNLRYNPLVKAILVSYTGWHISHDRCPKYHILLCECSRPSADCDLLGCTGPYEAIVFKPRVQVVCIGQDHHLFRSLLRLFLYIFPFIDLAVAY